MTISKFLQIGTGAINRDFPEKLYEIVSVTDFGAVGNGTDDDTDAIQYALNVAGTIYIPAGTYVVQPLVVQSNSTIVFDANTVLIAKTGYTASQSLLTISAKTNVTIIGNYGTVQMLKAEYVTGESRHCVSIMGSSNVAIYNLIARDSGGDGFYVGGNIANNQINLIGCVADNNRRQGLSIVNVIGCNVIGGEYKNTIGTAPECGIDVESNLLDGYYLQNVNISGVSTLNNNGGGILITPQSRYAPVSISVTNCTSKSDGTVGGLCVKAAMAYTGSTDPALIGKIYGTVRVKNMNVVYPQGAGVTTVNWTENAPDTLLENIYVLNPYSNGAYASTDRNKVALLIRGETPSSGTYGTSIGNIVIDGLHAEDSRGVPLMRIPVYFEPADEATKPLKNITLKNVVANSTEWTSTSLTPILSSSTLARTNVVIDYGYDRIVSSNSYTIGLADVGAVVSTIASSNFTLPAASMLIGSSVTFRHINAGNLRILLSASDVIDGYSLATTVGLMANRVGAEITLKAASAGRWQVTNVTQGWAVDTYTGQRIPQTYNSAAPTSGTWSRGDIVYNTAPSAGGTVGWICVVAGTPGTWKAFGNIAA